MGSVENIPFNNVLGGINRRWKARIDWRNHINGFDMFTVPAGKGKLEKILKKIFEFSAVPAGKGKLEKILKKIFEFSAVPAGEGKLKKMSRWTSSS